jgi:hypothetical protein
VKSLEDPDLPEGHPWISEGCKQTGESGEPACPLCYPEKIEVATKTVRKKAAVKKKAPAKRYKGKRRGMKTADSPITIKRKNPFRPDTKSAFLFDLATKHKDSRNEFVKVAIQKKKARDRHQALIYLSQFERKGLLKTA